MWMAFTCKNRKLPLLCLKHHLLHQLHNNPIFIDLLHSHIDYWHVNTWKKISWSFSLGRDEYHITIWSESNACSSLFFWAWQLLHGYLFFLFLLCIVAAIKVWWPCQLLSLDFIVQTSNICRVTTVIKRAFHIVAKKMTDMAYEWDNVYCFIWAATWQNQQSECAPSEDSDPPGHPPNLIRVFAVRMKKPWVLSYPLSAQRRLWSDWADAQADLSLRWAHTHFVGFVMSRLICFSSFEV